MALATTCPQCKTSFKVIPDQLKLRRGLVRCGVCQHVFSGIDYLRYVDESGKGKAAAATDPAAERPGPGSRPVAPGPRPTAAPQTIIAADDELKTAFFLSDSTFGPYTQTRVSEPPPPAAPRGIVLPRAGSDFARDFANEGTTRIGPLPDTGPRTRAAEPTAPARGRASEESRAPADPPRGLRRLDPAEDFDPPPAETGRRSRRRSLLEDDDADVAAANALARQAREARRRREGNRDGSRSGHGGIRIRHGDDAPYRSFADFFADSRRTGIVIGLGLLLGLQMLLVFRSELVSRLPSARPVLEVVSGIFGLKIDTMRSLSSLTIESFELQNTDREDQIALNAVLRNRDNHAARWPAMELRLTDAAGAVVVRKVILPTDYLNRTAPRDGLGGRSEWPVRLLLETGTMQLAGYSVELFYP